MFIFRIIAEHANLPLKLVIPSIDGISISCCWGCNLGERPILFKDLKRIWTYKTHHRNDFDIDLLYEINATYQPFDENDTISLTSTKFFMKPGSISDMLKEITCPYRNLWFLNNCNLRFFWMRNYWFHQMKL